MTFPGNKKDLNFILKTACFIFVASSLLILDRSLTKGRNAMVQIREVK